MSEEREAQHEGYGEWIRDNLDSGYRPGLRAAWFAALEWQAERIEALEAKCALLAVSLDQADKRVAELEACVAGAMDEHKIDIVSKALRRAWQLGQTYWQQADSESWTQQDKSAETQREFEALADETRAALAKDE